MVDRSPTVTWAPSFSTLNRYSVYYKISTDTLYTTLITSTTSTGVNLPSGTLTASKTYRWYYTRTTLGITTRYPEGTGYFTFTTNAVP
jgi:hypothetical protein